MGYLLITSSIFVLFNFNENRTFRPLGYPGSPGLCHSLQATDFAPQLPLSWKRRRPHDLGMRWMWLIQQANQKSRNQVGCSSHSSNPLGLRRIHRFGIQIHCQHQEHLARLALVNPSPRSKSSRRLQSSKTIWQHVELNQKASLRRLGCQFSHQALDHHWYFPRWWIVNDQLCWH